MSTSTDANGTNYYFGNWLEVDNPTDWVVYDANPIPATLNGGWGSPAQQVYVSLTNLGSSGSQYLDWNYPSWSRATGNLIPGSSVVVRMELSGLTTDLLKGYNGLQPTAGLGSQSVPQAQFVGNGVVFGVEGQTAMPTWATVNALAIQCHGTRGISSTAAVWHKSYYAGGQRIATSETNLTGTTVSYTFSDHLGSVVLVTDKSFSPISAYRYSDWGAPRYTGGTPVGVNDFAYTGQRGEG